MTTNILFAANSERWSVYESHLRRALDAQKIDYTLGTDMPKDQVDYIIYGPGLSEIEDFSAFPRLRAVLNLWAGVENIVKNPTLTVPLARMVDEEGLTQGMVEWVTGHTLRHHLGMDAHIVNPDHEWNHVAPPLAAQRPVTILGLGELGMACARSLRQLGFPVTGWSRRQRSIAGVTCYSGPDQFHRALDGAQIVVLLLPLTPDTENTLDAHAIGRLAPGAVVLNPGRGPLIDDGALLAALDSGRLSHATLDTFRIEPLPAEHPFWAHDKVTVTPHIASETRPASASRVIADNIRRGIAGKPLQHLVDRDAGY